MCECIKKVNKMLEEKNSCLVTSLVGTECVALLTERLVPTRPYKSIFIAAEFCPFCGEKYTVQRVFGEEIK